MRRSMYQRGNQTGKTIWIIVAALLCLMVVQTAGAERIKDLAVIAGVRSNYLVGYGLIVGLDRSGDQTIQTPLQYKVFLACCVNLVSLFRQVSFLS